MVTLEKLLENCKKFEKKIIALAARITVHTVKCTGTQRNCFKCHDELSKCHHELPKCRFFRVRQVSI